MRPFSHFIYYNLNSDDLWPWYATLDLINKWRFPCCIYDPTLDEIHQIMWKVEPNVNLFSQQTTTTATPTGDKAIPVVFRARADDTKTVYSSKLFVFYLFIYLFIFFFFLEKELFIYNTVALVIAAEVMSTIISWFVKFVLLSTPCCWKSPQVRQVP